MAPKGNVHKRLVGFDPVTTPTRQSTKDILAHPRIVHMADDTAKALVIALKDEILVHPKHRPSGLGTVATKIGKLSGRPKVGKVSGDTDIEVWQLTSGALQKGASLHWARHLRDIVAIKGVELATVTPHHVAVVSLGGTDHWNACPSGLPTAGATLASGWIQEFTKNAVDVVAIDTGYVPGWNQLLDARGGIVGEPGWWLDETGHWQESDPDLADANLDGKLDDIAGHGTFAIGLIAHRCSEAFIRAVGLRHAVMQVNPPPHTPDSRRLFTSEVSVATSLLRHRGADVILCQFAFPAFDGYPPLAAWGALENMSNRPAIVSPAGNEETTAPYWPAAFKRVIGVASTNRDGPQATVSGFSNWGTWVDCCAIGSKVPSTYLTWPLPPAQPTFKQKATWNGTCFSAAKVVGAIAQAIVTGPSGITPMEAYNSLGVIPASNPRRYNELSEAGVSKRRLDLG